ncbi:MAG TPA: ferredoxin-thioredoxin reductase catalytic domain-containing protein [Methanoregulaceae archaeon]|nr:ferredoxin-thioredoxin reductase catalytic domain-containing protein [Methanoregulaceae archaeon]
MSDPAFSRDAVVEKYRQIKKDAEEGGYFLNPDENFTLNLIGGLMVNEERFGYPACPCRLAWGVKEEDLDIICPCDYRDPDLSEYGTCYCALYVSGEVVDGSKAVGSIPERRLPRDERKKQSVSYTGTGSMPLPYPVWRCKVCGYLCARDTPPLLCPICKVKQDRFEQFI